ncbi:plant calmodulin-binding protein-like protein [Actinidia rufa]|uniref:Plant calmodulin-binding protein-like protein n=1 Tax=Actinidia rufa TaxID=165716 RepID=A0A7J0F0I4_9ERIC|nr:plant calmodulin-binding protein-like protein [Actinidia rufa]
MKSTSSFEARKERSQVSSRRIQTSFDSKSPKKIANNTNLGLVSGYKPVKTLTRTSSLKLVRTLTKSLSFKPARNLSKKCSQVVLCENLYAQRATCSSTLKDSKFPTYLDLSPGATESEGTSVTKVCPYTYCSLNGHRHAPSPPLKCFISARRRTLKTQKSMKLGCLSPRRAKPSGDGLKAIIDQIALDEKPAIQEMDSKSHEMDFFVEIYVKWKGQRKYIQPLSTQEEETAELLSNQNDFEVELDGTDLETSDVEWEEGQNCVLSMDDDVGNSSKPTNNLESGSSFGNDDPSVPEEAILKCDNFDEISADEGLEEFFEEGASSNSEGSCQNLGMDESIQAFDKQNHLVSPTCVELEESTVEESDGNADSDDFVATANNVVEDQNRSEKDKDQSFKISDSLDSDDETPSRLNKVSAAENANEDANEMEVEYSTMLEPEEIPLLSGDEVITRAKTAYTRGSKRPIEELAKDPNNLRITRCKRPDKESEEAKKFNPQEPNYLPVEPDPEAEKVDLRHQMMDERRNSEEWMIDYALQQAVTKLAPARKRKVALLVEAFENVMPIPKYESRLRHTPPAAFAHARPMQACS